MNVLREVISTETLYDIKEMFNHLQLNIMFNIILLQLINKFITNYIHTLRVTASQLNTTVTAST